LGTLTGDGLEIRTFTEVLEDIVTAEQTNIDSNISTEDNEVLGQLNNIMSEQITAEEELAQSVYDAFNPLKAEGISLDNLAALVGIRRIDGTASSTTTQQYTGDNGITIPIGSLISNPINGDRFSNTSAVALDTLSCQSTKYSVKDLLDTTEYTVTINGIDVAFTSGGSATELGILNGLDAYNTANYSDTAIYPWTMSVDTVNLQLIITATADNIGVTSITYISADEVTNIATAEATVVGATIAPSNSVTSIVTSLGGWTSTTNLSPYIVGRERETDEELRQRILTSQQIIGVATVEAIQDALGNTAGVTTAIVEENELTTFSGGSNIVTFTNGTNIVNWTSHTLSDGDGVQFESTGTLPAELASVTQYWVVNSNTNDFQVALTQGGSVVTFTDDGTPTSKVLIARPPKSFESVVQGGTDAAIGATIWATKPAGIETFGNTSVTIQDSNNVDRTLNFSRPTAIPVTFIVNISTYDEESLTADYESSIQTAVDEFTTSLGIGVDVLPSRYYAPIQLSSSGFYITSITVNDGGGATSTQLVIDSTQFATVTDPSTDIVVTLT
jgi:uncharacterized phage protein gp47/JayE